MLIDSDPNKQNDIVHTGLIQKIGNRIYAMLYKYRFLLRRIGVSFITLVLAMCLSFLMLQLMPGDSVDQYAVKLSAEMRIPFEEARELAIKTLGYNPDQPVYLKLFDYVNNLLHGNLGKSIVNQNLNVNIVIQKTLPWTLLISTVSLILSFGLGTLLGATMAWKRGKTADSLMTGYVVLASAVPDYILAIIALYILAFKLNIFPRMGAYDIQYTPGFNLAFIGNCLYHAALPILSYTFIQTANWALLMKGSSVAVLGDDYIAAAKARGVPNPLLINRYLKKNAMLPLFASLTLAFATIFGGSPLVESIFNYPGIGQAFSTYISQRDYFLIVGILLFTSFIVVVANLVADSLYSFIDPRIRRGS